MPCIVYDNAGICVRSWREAVAIRILSIGCMDMLISHEHVCYVC